MGSALKAQKKIKQVLTSILIIAIVLIDIYPLFWMITASLQEP